MVTAAPAVVIAAPASGNGKTTVATGLMAALTATGRKVAPFKVGPDFIDPAFHALATGKPGRNLDANLQGGTNIGPLYAHGAQGADIAVIEGVMGLFDGRIGHSASDGVSGYGSTSDVAARLGAPVLLVVDVRGYSTSLAALVRGFATHATGLRVAGVILNQVGSPRHTEILTAACAEAGLPVFGAVPRDAGLAVPSRHLGLLTPDAEASTAATAIRAMGEAMTAHLDLDAICAVAHSTAGEEPWRPEAPLTSESATSRDVSRGSLDTESHTHRAGQSYSPCIAIAHGPAFGFRYPEWDEMFRAQGAELCFFDPRHDAFPAKATGVFLPGGYPEEHAAELAANASLRRDLRDRINAGMPVYAECGGLAYLGEHLDGHNMVAALPGDYAFGARLHLGYRDAVALTDSVALQAGQRVVGHEFHRTSRIPDSTSGKDATEAPAALVWRSAEEPSTTIRDGVALPHVHASYLHLHPVGAPQVVAGLVAAAADHTLKA